MGRELTWAERHAREARKVAERRMGSGWTLIGPEIRAALIAREVLYLVTMQADETMAKNPALAEIAEVARIALADER